MKTHGKLVVLVVVIVGTLVWLAAAGIKESATYYKTLAEVEQMQGQAVGKRLRVAGDVEPGSIVNKGREVHFTLSQDQLRLNVVYTGSAPLPDTFQDGAQAVADGKLNSNGVFQASKIQAKCASKYEAKPGQNTPASQRAGT